MVVANVSHLLLFRVGFSTRKKYAFVSLLVGYYLFSIHFLIFQIPGLVNVDFADVKAVMKDSGTAMLGVGVSSSKNRAEEAAEQATLAPLIGSSIQSATGVVYNITGGKDITLQEVNRVSQVMNLLCGLFDNLSQSISFAYHLLSL